MDDLLKRVNDLSPDRRKLLAKLLKKRSTSLYQEEVRSCLVEIQASHTRQSFFCVHPSGGSVFCYMHLARHLGSDQSFYGFQSQGLDQEQPPLATIEEMAARYVGELLAIQSTGPYLLGGWSMGGLVAFEMARRLQLQGERVALLALIDTAAPRGSRRPVPTDEIALMINFALDMGLHLESLAELDEAVRLLSPNEQLAEVLALAKVAHIVAPEMELQHIQQLFHVFRTNFSAAHSYMPRVWHGHLTLLRAANQHAEALSDPKPVWDKLASEGAQVITVPGNHFTMMREPQVKILAEQLRACIDQALQAKPILVED